MNLNDSEFEPDLKNNKIKIKKKIKINNYINKVF